MQLAGPKIVLHFPHPFVCILVCASPLLTYPIITSRTSLPCNVTLVDLMAALSTSVATMSSLDSYEFEITRLRIETM